MFADQEWQEDGGNDAQEPEVMSDLVSTWSQTNCDVMSWARNRKPLVSEICDVIANRPIKLDEQFFGNCLLSVKNITKSKDLKLLDFGQVIKLTLRR